MIERGLSIGTKCRVLAIDGSGDSNTETYPIVGKEVYIVLPYEEYGFPYCNSEPDGQPIWCFRPEQLEQIVEEEWG